MFCLDITESSVMNFQLRILKPSNGIFSMISASLSQMRSGDKYRFDILDLEVAVQPPSFSGYHQHRPSSTMSTAHRPTWDPAQARDVKGGSRQVSVRDMPSHTKLKFRYNY